MRSTAPRSTGMRTAIRLSGAEGAGIGPGDHPALPSYREPRDLPDAPLMALVGIVDSGQVDDPKLMFIQGWP